MSEENIFQRITSLRDRLALLEARIGPFLRSAVSTELLEGVMPLHIHGGTGGGGGTLAPTTFKLPATASDPAYIDGYAIIYFYSTGGVDELRVRGKIGAVETQVTIENLSP
jgi:hypothetical protein